MILLRAGTVRSIADTSHPSLGVISRCPLWTVEHVVRSRQTRMQTAVLVACTTGLSAQNTNIQERGVNTNEIVNNKN